MDELDALSRFRSDLPEPPADDVARSRERLIAEIRASAGGKRPGKPRRRTSRTGLVVTITALIALPSGFAIAQVLDDDNDSEISPGGFLEPEDCPEATAAFEAAGIPGFSESYVDFQGCPTEQRVNEIIRLVQKDEQLREEMEAKGLFPSAD